MGWRTDRPFKATLNLLSHQAPTCDAAGGRLTNSQVLGILKRDFIKMKMIFFGTPAQAHINPTLPIIEELVKQGEHVIYYASESFRDKIEKTGGLFREYPIHRSGPITPPFPNYVKLYKAILSYTEQVFQQLISEARNDQVDYIMHDSVCFVGWAVAKDLRIPAVCSTATLAFNGKLLRYITQQSYIPGAQLLGTVILNGLSALKVWNSVRRLHRAYNIDISLRNILNLVINRSELNLVYTSKEFQPFAEEFDDSYRFVGPTIPQDTHVAETPIQGIGRKIIFISLGTVRTARPDFFRSCLAAFRDTEYQVIMLIGQKISISDLGEIPSNVIVRNFVPWQIEALSKSSLAICHGGMVTLTQALFYGVPLLLLPQSRENFLNARRVEELGAGRIVREQELRADRIRELADTLMEQTSYKAAAERLSQSLRSAGGVRRAVQEIDEFKRRFVNKSKGIPGLN